MFINKIALKNFRNYADLNLDFSNNGCIITGKNGIGKTNLLEAIAYFSFGKSVLNSKDIELVKFEQSFFKITADFFFSGKNNLFDITFNDYKCIHFNDIWIKKVSELYQYLQIIYFSPDDINLIIGNPKNRRSFLDLAIYKIYWNYIDLIKAYHNVINQRNSLLKNDFSLKEKQSWDEQMINLGTDIIQYRLNFLDDFIPVLQHCYSEITGFTENIDIEYQCSFKFQKSQIKSDFHKKCLEILSNEKQYQRTLIGPHLDDIYFRINGQSVAKFASQGQKRSLVIALKIALAKMIHNNCGIYPILIFDDTLAELDISRSQNLINMLSQNHQLFIATPNLNHYSDFNLQILELEKIIHA